MNKFVAAFILMAFIWLATAGNVSAMQSDGQGDPETCPSMYSVRRGDSLRAIAKRCGTTLAQILNENPAITNPNRIFPGQQITLPAAIEPAATSIPASEVDQALPPVPLTSIQATAAAQPADPPATEEPAEQPAPEVYYVKRGDTLGKIGRLFDIRVDILLLANPNITNPNRIYVNQPIVLPTAEQLQALISEQERREAEEQQRIVDAIGLDGERWIDVDLRQQKVRAYDGRELVKTFVVSTGRARTPTVTGQYKIWIKLEFDDMRGPGYFLRDVPYVMYFHKGYGLHGTYWHENFGTPMSHGCVNLRTEDARWLFEFAEVGTVVNVH